MKNDEKIGHFERLWNRYKSCFTQVDCPGHAFLFNGEENFSKAVNRHFRNCRCSRKYGVYIAFSRDGCEIVAKGEAIYVGKAGTIKNSGSYKGQDIQARLKASRDKSNGNVWWGQLKRKYGPLIIEYVCLPKNALIAPALAEARLLQAFLNQYGRLPKKNNAF